MIAVEECENMDFMNDLPDISYNNELKSAGKVNFNTTLSSDYITSEAYKSLRTNILFCGTDIKTIVITSYQENDGKSTVSSELVKTLADAGKKTILIDADMRKSVLVHKDNKNSNFYGLSEYLSGQAELPQILFNTQHSDFDVIFSGHFPPNPVELLGNKRFVELLEHLKKFYDYIIIDSPPLGAVVDAAVIASCCDGSIIVLASGKVSYSEALSVKNQLMKSGCRILGAILNDTSRKKTAYSKQQYKKYYATANYINNNYK